MARLDDSLSRLSATQAMLKEVIDKEQSGSVDGELTQAYKENMDVM